MSEPDPVAPGRASAEGRSAKRRAPLADLLREAHRLGDERLPAAQILPRLFRVLLQGLGGDRGAVLQRQADGRVELRLVVNLERAAIENERVPPDLGDSHRVDSARAGSAADRYLLTVAGPPPLLWHQSSQTGTVVLVGQAPGAGSTMPVEGKEHELLRLFLELFEEVRGRRFEISMLRDSEERFRDFVENMSDAAFRTDSGGHLTYVNRTARELVGLPDEELIGTSLSELLRDGSRESAVRALEKIMRGENQDVELVLSNGVVLQLRARPLRDRHGSIVGSFGTARDVTRRRQDEHFLRTLVDNSLQGITIIQDGLLVYVNPPFAEIFESGVARLTGTRLKELIDRRLEPEDRARVWDRFQRRVAGEDVESRYRITCLRRDGGRFRVEMQACMTVYRGRPAVQVAMLRLPDAVGDP